MFNKWLIQYQISKSPVFKMLVKHCDEVKQVIEQNRKCQGCANVNMFLLFINKSKYLI